MDYEEFHRKVDDVSVTIAELALDEEQGLDDEEKELTKCINHVVQVVGHSLVDIAESLNTLAGAAEAKFD
jgi:hypothetical protein